MVSRLFLSTVVILCLLGGCRRSPSATTPVASPDGSMVAVPDTSGEVAIVIKDKAGVQLFRWETGASPHQGWSIQWKDNRTLELSSSDIGGYILERLPDQTWRETTPGGVFSPDGKLKVQTSWEPATRKLRIQFYAVTELHRSYRVQGDFTTDFVISDPSNCARWDGNGRVIVNTVNGEHSWAQQSDGSWTREK